MKYIIIENGDIYSVSDKLSKHIEAAFDLTSAIDGDMSDLIDAVKEYGQFVGTAFIVIRN